MNKLQLSNEPSTLVKRRAMSFKTKEALLFYAFISPFLVMLLVLKVIPFGWGIFMSFTNYTGFNLDSLKSVGINNYIRVFTDSNAYSALGATIIIGVITVPATLFISLALAMLLNQNIKGVGFFRTVYYFPSIIPAIATGAMWRIMFNQNDGILNTILNALGMDSVNWLGLIHARQSLIIYILWGSGTGILTYLAALKSVSRELYEAAEIDGASSTQKFKKITLPMLSSVIFFNLVNGLIAAWQRFFEPVFLQQGAGGSSAGLGILAVPPRPNYTFLVHVYQQIFAGQRFGYGLAMIWVIFFMSIILTRVTFYTSKYWVFNENEIPQEKVKKKRGRSALNE